MMRGALSPPSARRDLFGGSPAGAIYVFLMAQHVAYTICVRANPARGHSPAL